MMFNLRRLFSSDNVRTDYIKKNVGATFILRAISIAASFILVPMTIDYVSAELYGIWLTLSSIVQWLSFFDIGFGNGLRNKLATALALKKYNQGKIFVSTTYFILSLIFLIVGITVWFIVPLINWSMLLNVSPQLEDTLINVVRIVLVTFVVQIVLKVIQNVCQAHQLQSLSSAIDTFSNILALIAIYILTKTTFPSLQNLALVFTLCPIVLLITFSVYLYSTKFKQVAPSFSCIKFSCAGDIFSLGSKFFIIQIAAIMYFQTTNLIISNICGAESVSVYNIAYKYLNIALMILSIILAPVWSAFTDAYAKEDYPWMNQLFNKLFRIFLLCTLGILGLVIASPIIYTLWLGDKIFIPFSVTIALAFYMIILAWSQMLVTIINGVGKVKMQMWCSILVLAIYLPLSFALGIRWGLLGIISALFFTAVPNAIVAFIQVKKILLRKAVGVWNA